MNREAIEYFNGAPSLDIRPFAVGKPDNVNIPSQCLDITGQPAWNNPSVIGSGVFPARGVDERGELLPLTLSVPSCDVADYGGYLPAPNRRSVEVDEMPRSLRPDTVRQRGRSRGWCFTHFTDDLPCAIPFCTIDSCSTYYCVQSEICPKSLRPHLQGFVYFASVKSFNQVREALSFLPSCHLQAAKGTPKQNRNYCSKADSAVSGSFIEAGVLPEVTYNPRTGYFYESILVHDPECGCDSDPCCIWMDDFKPWSN